MANPYYVAPLGGLDIGGKMTSILEGGRERYKEQQWEKTAPDIIKSGDPSKIADLMTQYPEKAQQIAAITGYKDRRALQNRVDMAKKVLTGEETIQEALVEHIKTVDAQGGDTTQLVNQLGKALADPNYGKKWSENTLALYDPPSYKTYMSTRTSGLEDITDTQKEYMQAVGSGQFNGSLLEWKLQTGGKDKTEAIKEYEYGIKNPKFIINKRQKEQNKRNEALKKQSFSDSKDLRKEFLGQSSEYQKVRDAYTRVIKSTQDPSPAGDLSLIFNYMKMLDPGSVVRESEFATAASAGSYGERIKAAVNKITDGERLSPKMREDFLKKSKSLLSGMDEQHRKREKTYTDLAKRNNLPVDDVVVDLTAPEYQQDEPVKQKPVSEMSDEELKKAARIGGE